MIRFSPSAPRALLLPLVLALAAGGASASVLCGHSAGSTTANGSVYAGACEGPVAGSFAAGGAPASLSLGGQVFDLAASTSSWNGWFAATPGAVRSGVLQFAQPLTGSFVIGLGATNNYALYLYDAGGSGIASISFDTQGLRQGNSGVPGPLLQGAVLYLPQAAPIPEPGAALLLLAGLGVVGFVARRRAAR